MDPHAWIALATLIVAAVLFFTKWLPIGVTALAIPVVLVVTGVLPDTRDALAGFGNHAVIAIGSIFVVGGGLQESGVASLIAGGLHHVGGRSEPLLVTLVMLASAALSTVMNNAAAVALLLPAAVALCHRSVVAPSRLLMPLAFAAVLGGTVTMIGTAPNLLVADFLSQQDIHIGVFEFARVGVFVVIAGVGYMVLIGRRLLPSRTDEDRLKEADFPADVAESYGVAEHLFRMNVVPESRLVGRSVREVDIRGRYGLNLVMVARPHRLGGRRVVEATPDLVFQQRDRLVLEGEDVDAWHFAEEELLQFGLASPQAVERMLGRGMTLAEVTIPPRSQVEGRTLEDVDFPERYGLHVLSGWVRGAPVRDGVLDAKLDVGDTFLVAGPVERVRHLMQKADYIVLTDQSRVEDISRAPLAVLLLLVAVVPPLVTSVPLAISALAAALLMVVTRCISTQGLRRALDWKVLALIIGTMPLGKALQTTGVASHAAEGILSLTAGLGVTGIIAVLFAITSLVAMFSTNAAAAVVVSPVAAQAALAADMPGLTVRTALLAVAFGCSCSFVLPFAQWNLIVMTPGGYRSSDYFKVGLGLSLVMAVTAVTCLALGA